MRIYMSVVCLSVCFLCTYPVLAGEPRPINELTHLLKKSQEDTGRVSLLLEIGLWYVYKPGAAPRDIDSAIFFTNRAMVLSKSLKQQRWEGKSLLQYSIISREHNDTSKGKEFINNAIAIISKYGTKADLGYAYYELANYYNPYLGGDQFDKRIWYIEQSAHFFDLANEKGKYAEVLYTLCDLYMMERAYSKSLDTIQKVLSIYHETNNASVQYLYDLTGAIYGSMGNYTMEIKNCQLAVQATEKTKDTSLSTCTIYNRMGIAYDNIKQPEQAIPYYKRAISVAMKYNDRRSIFTIMPNLMSSYRMSGQPARSVDELELVEREYKPVDISDRIRFVGIAAICYLELKRYDLAEKYHRELLAIYNTRPDDDPLQVYVYSHLIEYCLITKKYLEAANYCLHNDRFCRKYGYIKGSSKNYLQWSIADSAQGHYAAALSHYQMHVSINDSLYNEAKTKEIAQLQIQYETEKKEQNIQLLTRQTQLQNTQLRQTKLTKNLLFGSAGLLALLLGLGYNRYRLKQRSNKELQAKQEEINKKNESLNQLVKEKEWLVKEMHHRVKNNLQIIISLLNTQSLYLDNEAAQSAIKESQQRLHTISMIHQKLYQSDNSTMINMQTYVNELIDYLKESLNASPAIHFEKHINAIELDVAQAIPIGLILNEAITNSIKYAFPGNAGMINIKMLIGPDGNIVLQIEDNGVGLPANESIGKSGSMGLSLISGLASQLGSTYTIRNDNGVKIKLEFPYIKDANNHIK